MRRETMRALSSPQLLHGAVEQSFDGERQRNLWRIDWLGERCYLLLLSPERPDLTHIAQQFGYPEREPLWETRDYDPLLTRVAEGQAWRFRLRANPVHSCTKPGRKRERGQVLAHLTPAQQKHWLLTRAAEHGFLLTEVDFDVVHTEWQRFRKGSDRQEVSLRTAAFEGILTVTDPVLFRKTLLSGIGRAKAYGCGLMTIMRIHT